VSRAAIAFPTNAVVSRKSSNDVKVAVLAIDSEFCHSAQRVVLNTPGHISETTRFVASSCRTRMA
jgi:hypothetical protein